MLIAPLLTDSLYPDTWKDELVAQDRQMLQKRLTAIKSVAAVLGNSVASMAEITPQLLDPLGLISNAEFLKRAKHVREREVLDMNDRNFNPRVFLGYIHDQTSFEDLASASDMLKEQIEAKKEEMQSNVKMDFDRFVSAKATIDGTNYSTKLT
jgi:hypothetical protein